MTHFQSAYEEARRRDAQLLESKISLYARNTQEALRQLNIKQRGMEDALIAMQRVSMLIIQCITFPIASKLMFCSACQNLSDKQDGSPESRILKIGIECIERSSKLKTVKSLPDWIVSSFEVDIDEEEELGSGGFSVVRKGTWHGILVAVKTMTPETSHEVIRVCFLFVLFVMTSFSQDASA
jgi:hypothetical protein